MLHREHLPWAVLLSVVCLQTAQSSSDSNEPTIPFSSSLPLLPAPISKQANSSSNLKGYYDLAGKVVSGVRPGQLPHETIVEAIRILNERISLGWNISSPEQDEKDVTTEFLQWFAPAIVAIASGVFLAVVFPCVGCCIPCCRMSGHCGAKSRQYRKKQQNTKCFIMTIIFLLSVFMILIGTILGFFSIQRLSDSINQFQATVDDGLDDLSNYLTGGTKQLEFVADNQFSVFENYVLNDLARVGEWFEDSIEGDIAPDSDNVLSSAESLLEILRGIDSSRRAGNELIGDIKCVASELVTQVSTLNQALENLTALCSSGLCNANFSSLMFGVNVNYSDIGNVNFIDDIDLNEIAEQISNATDILHDVADFINTEAEKYGLTDTAKEEFQKAREKIQDQAITRVNDTLSDITSEGGIIGEARAEVDNALKYLDTYENYMFGVAVTILAMFVLIVVLFLAGIFVGSFGYSREVPPHRRSSVSHCGGRFLLVGIVAVFVSIPLLLVVTSASYGLATGVQKVCGDLQDPDYSIFRQVADNPSAWGGYTLVGAVTREAASRTVNVSISHVLSECGQNEPIWRVLNGDSLFVLNFTNEVNCSSFGIGGSNGNDFLPFDDFDSGSIFPNLTDIENSYNIDFQEYYDLVNDSVLSFSLDQLDSDLKDEQNASNQTNPNGLVVQLTTNVLQDLQNINVTVITIQQLQMYIEGNISNIELAINESQCRLSNFTSILDAFLHTLNTVTSNAVDEYVQRLCGFVDQYIDYALQTIKGEVGRCWSLHNAYSSIYSGMCRDALDGLNGFWFSLGCCFLFSIPAVVLGIMLSDYFRKARIHVVHCKGSCSKDSSSERTSLITPDNCSEEDDVSVIQLVSHRQSNQTYPASESAAHFTEDSHMNLPHTPQMDLDW